jgi:hypothetical protein
MDIIRINRQFTWQFRIENSAKRTPHFFFGELIVIKSIARMWTEEGGAFVRAPAPQNFDRLVQALEDSDSVLFESISLPSLAAPPPADDPGALADQLRALERADAEKAERIRARAAQIASLERRIAELRAGSADGQDPAEAYRAAYERVLMELEGLKASLSKRGKLRKVAAKSARAIKPAFV